MGKKGKIGKRRKDKFYHLAKETGYRARSAFKLIQLNRKFQFLQQSRVLVDLCAAPGGWLQVASKFMPVSSLIVGVDLVPIKPIPKVITFQEDITTSRCKQQLQRELKTWKADCFLNDGAPNVGSAWVQDAFSQALLTLSALKLACEFLREGGWFITKVFRSKEYQPLMWVLQQLFHKVNATKPQASRLESAEIFVVCRGYLAPSKIDPKMLDPKHVFEEVEREGKQEERVSLAKLQKPPKTAEGYPDDARVLFKSTSVADFITDDNYFTLLGTSNKLHFDKPSEVFAKHPLTTEEIKQYCEDIKVLGPRELKQLIRWREKMRKFLNEVGSDGEEEEEEGKRESVKGDGDDELAQIDVKVQELEREEAAELKRERRRLRKEKRKIRERLVKKAEMHMESGEILRQEELFRLKDIRSKSQLEEVEKGEMVPLEEGEVYVGEEEEEEGESEGESVTSEGESDSEGVGESGAESDEGESGTESDEEEELSLKPNGDMGNPLVVPLENAAVLRSRRAKLWFSKSVFENLETERDEDEELQHMLKSYEGKSGHVWSEEGKEVGSKGMASQGEKGRKLASGQAVNGEGSDVESMDESELEEEQSLNRGDDDQQSSDDSSSKTSEDDWDEAQRTAKKAKGNAFEVVPGEETKHPMRKLDPEGLVIGALMVQSKKKREDLIESAFNRWTSNDDNLPEWFRENEARYCQKQLPVTKEMMAEYRTKLREITARPIKKIAEAKARKKRRTLKKLENARKRAESITDAVDVTEHEKMQQLKQVYKKAGVLGKRKKEVKYVVARKGMATKKMRKPAGVKGPFRVVDPRLKKDTRAKLRKQRKGRRKH